MKLLAGNDLEAFRKLDPSAAIALIRGTTGERTFVVERDAIDKDARTAWFSIASERVYSRWWGEEILDHGKESIRTERLDSGANFLVGHDTSDVVGVVDQWEISPEKKLRILVRFGRSARAEEIFQDVFDGIRRNTSVGYIIHDLRLEKSDAGVNTYRVTDWEVLEGSLVAVPADPSVGQGRALEPTPNKRTDMDPIEKALIESETRAKVEAEFRAKAEADARATADAARAAANTPEAVLKREQERVAAIIASGDQYANLGGPELARELIKDAGATTETFKARMLDQLGRGSAPTPVDVPAVANYGDAARVRFRHGRLKAFKDLPLQNGKTMAADEAAHRAGMWLAATVFKKDWANKWCRENGMDLYYKDADSGQVRVMSGGTNAAGGALVPIEMEQAVIDLRDTYGVIRRLVRVRPMSTDQKQIPRRTGGLTAYFFNDDDGTGITASDKGWDDVTLSAKKLGVLARVSKDLIEDAVIDVVDDLAQEMAYAFAVKEDECGINGDGTSTYGGMTGFRPKLGGTAYASRITTVANHDTFAEIDSVDLSTTMGGVAAFGKPGAKWLMSETGKAIMIDRLKSAAGGNDLISLGGMLMPAYLGYQIETSEAMPSDAAADYTGLVMAMFGRFDLAASMGTRRGIEVTVLNERYAELGQLGIVATERFDLVVHDLGTTAIKGPVAAMYGA